MNTQAEDTTSTMTEAEDVQALLNTLWETANEHCVLIYAEWIDNSDGDSAPPRPEKDADLLKKVIEYLKNSM